MQGFKVGLGGDLQLIIASGIFDHQRAGRGHDALHLVVQVHGRVHIRFVLLLGPGRTHVFHIPVRAVRAHVKILLMPSGIGPLQLHQLTPGSVIALRARAVPLLPLSHWIALELEIPVLAGVDAAAILLGSAIGRGPVPGAAKTDVP